MEAAFYLGVPNLRPPLPLDQFAIPLQALRRVVWSAAGAHRESSAEERAHVLGLAARNPNLAGIILDDFFVDKLGSDVKRPPCHSTSFASCGTDCVASTFGPSFTGISSIPDSPRTWS